MKRIHLILLALFLLIGTAGCAGPASGSVKNEIFTDEFFADVVEIYDSRAGVVSGDHMKPVIQYLKGLALTATNEHLSTTNENGDQLTGLDAVTFKRDNGTEIVFLRNHLKMSCVSGLDVCSYVVESGNLNSGLKEAFSQTEKNVDE